MAAAALPPGALARQIEALSPRWRDALGPAAGLASVVGFVEQRIAAGAIVYPPRPFAALESLEASPVRVVVVGQDPYHGPGQADGRAFSVPAGVALPPSLRNIFVELRRDLGLAAPADGDLGRWARQGVLLLNAVLTVEDGAANSHADRGWEAVTASLLRTVAADPAPKAWLLWGTRAQRSKDALERIPNAAVLVANHPSPLSARRPPLPFVGCGHFSAANRFLAAHGLPPIAW